MKKAAKPGGATKLAPKGITTKQSAAKSKAKSAAAPKATAKSSAKPKPKIVPGQAELVQVVAQLAMSAEKLAQAADRLAEAANGLTEATIRKPHTPEGQNDTFKTLSESIADMTVSEGHAEGVDTSDLTATQEHLEMRDETEDH
jgi:hypothetical protein